MAGYLFSYTIPSNTFSEPEGETITLDFSVSPSASWLSLDAATSTISGTPPNNAAAGDYTITVKADDPNAFVSTTTTTMPLKVIENQSPTIDNVLPLDLNTRNGYLFSYTIPSNTFSDAESETITYSFSITPAATWLSFDSSTHIVSGTPTLPAHAGDYTISIIADDTQSFTAATTASAPLKVEENKYPQISNPITNGPTVVVRYPLTFTFPENTFMEPEGEPITYSYSITPSASWISFK